MYKFLHKYRRYLLYTLMYSRKLHEKNNFAEVIKILAEFSEKKIVSFD